MSRSNSRRNFIKQAGAAAAALTTLSETIPAQPNSRAVRPPRPLHSNARVIGANDRINVGFIGCGGRMKTHIDYLVGRSKEKGDVQPVAVCDIYDRRKHAARERAGVDEKSVHHDY